MIIVVKESRLEKVDPVLFNIISVSAKDGSVEDASFNMSALLPPADLLMAYNNGNIGKKKFAKKYIKFLSEENSTAENTIFTIAKSLSKNNNLCITCTDDEYNIGYTKILAQYIADTFGFECYKYGDAKESIESVYETLDLGKKDKKLIHSDESDLSNKKIKKRAKLIKMINKELAGDMSQEGAEYYESLDKKYALDQVVCRLGVDEVISFNKKGELESINIDNLSKSGAIIAAINAVADSDKSLKKIIKRVAESHDVSIKPKKLKKLDKKSLVSLAVEMYSELVKYRSGVEE